MPEELPQYQTKSAYAAAMLRRAFSEGQYTAGERLQVAKLANDLGLSLTPVREALFELANDGLIDLQPHRGARVADVPLTDLAELYLVRGVLESTATRLAADRATDEQCDELVSQHERLAEAVAAGERATLRKLSDDFHEMIYDMAQSPLLRRLIRTVWTTAPADTFTVIRDRPQRSVEDHERILEAIKSRDGDAAEELMRNHIQDSLELIRSAKEGTAAKTSGRKNGRRSPTSKKPASAQQPKKRPRAN